MAKLSEKAVTSASAITHFFVQTADGIRRLSKANLLGMFRTIECGYVDIKTTKNSEQGTASVSLSDFSGTPFVLLTAHSANPTAIAGLSTTDLSSDGFKIVLNRPTSDDITTRIDWVAVR